MFLDFGGYPSQFLHFSALEGLVSCYNLFLIKKCETQNSIKN